MYVSVFDLYLCMFLPGLENEPPPPGLDLDVKKKEPEMEDGEMKENKNSKLLVCEVFLIIP